MHKGTFLEEVHKDLKKKGSVTNKEQTKVIMDTFFDTLYDVITKGHYLTISDFGVFESKLRTFTNFGNDKERVQRWQIFFKPSNKMKKRINESITKK